MRDRKMQRALMQFFKPANWFTVREALLEAGRADVIGNRCDALIPAQPPTGAIDARRRQADGGGDHYHMVANPAKGETPGERGAGPLKTKGYRRGGKGARRQDGTRSTRARTRVRGPSRHVAALWSLSSRDTPSLAENSPAGIGVSSFC